MTSKKTQEPLETYLSLLEKAKNFRDLLEGDPTIDPDKWYKRFARICHPDVVPEHYRERSEKGFQRLQELWNEFSGKTASPQVVVAGYVVTGPLCKGDICDLHYAEADNNPCAVLKIARSPRDNDLMQREAGALKTLNASGDEFTKYLPSLFASVKASGRKVNIFSSEEDHQPLSDLVRMHNDPIDFRHIVWMVNRVLSVLGFAHRTGFIHGAVLPCHMMFDAEKTHGLKLVDWCYSCTKDQTVPAIVRDYSTHYPPEVGKKMQPGPGTDIYMLMKSMYRIAGNVPKRFRDLMQYCMVESPASRPHDAWEVQDRWMDIAKEVYGPPAYVQWTKSTN